MSAAVFGGWILSKLGDYALNKILEKFGLIDATCETCKATKTSIVIPEGKLVLVHCDQCGHSGKVYIPSLEMLPIQPAHIQAGQAHRAIASKLGVK